MTTFTIDEHDNITAYGLPQEAAAATATPFDSFANEKELADLAATWPADRLLAIWNSIPGVTPVHKFTSRKVALTRIWKRIAGLGQPPATAPQPASSAKATGRAPSPTGAPAKAKATKKAIAAKKAPKAKTAANKQEAGAPRQGSKMAQAIALMQRKGGVTLSELMKTMGWQKHTCRGFVAGALKKAGYPVESFKPEGGERSYRLPR